MRSHRSKLLFGTGLLLSAGLVAGGVAANANAAPSPTGELANPTAVSKPQAAPVRLAACNPCKAAKGCNPCAAKTGCNPCAAKKGCNPCAAKTGCNPCAAKKGCNPCAAKKNPCKSGAIDTGRRAV